MTQGSSAAIAIESYPICSSGTRPWPRQVLWAIRKSSGLLARACRPSLNDRDDADSIWPKACGASYVETMRAEDCFRTPIAIRAYTGARMSTFGFAAAQNRDQRLTLDVGVRL